MDRSLARWTFTMMPADAGIHITLTGPEPPLRDPPASAIIRADWPAERIALTLTALEEIYEALPEPPIPEEAG